jgi:hypothetical protein
MGLELSDFGARRFQLGTQFEDDVPHRFPGQVVRDRGLGAHAPIFPFLTFFCETILPCRGNSVAKVSSYA